MVKYRNPRLIVILFFVTIFAYYFYWLVSTTKELRALTSSAPSPTLAFFASIPGIHVFLHYDFTMKYCKTVASLCDVDETSLKMLFLFATPLGMYVTQNNLNKLSNADTQTG